MTAFLVFKLVLSGITSIHYLSPPYLVFCVFWYTISRMSSFSIFMHCAVSFCLLLFLLPDWLISNIIHLTYSSFLLCTYPHSVLRHIFTMSFGYDYTVLLTLARVYGGKKINDQSLYYFNPHMSLWSCIKWIDNRKMDMKMRPCTEGVNQATSILSHKRCPKMFLLHSNSLQIYDSKLKAQYVQKSRCCIYYPKHVCCQPNTNQLFIFPISIID